MLKPKRAFVPSQIKVCDFEKYFFSVKDKIVKKMGWIIYNNVSSFWRRC